MDRLKALFHVWQIMGEMNLKIYDGDRKLYGELIYAAGTDIITLHLDYNRTYEINLSEIEHIEYIQKRGIEISVLFHANNRTVLIAPDRMAA